MCNCSPTNIAFISKKRPRRNFGTGSIYIASAYRRVRITLWEWSGASLFSSPSTNLSRGRAARRLFRVPPCREATAHLQRSMTFPGFEPRPYGTAVSVTNHYTR
ncbi:hypothetical protein TNCV_3434381 [Trichonephila clavipes]|nr:hypothetical protein TNCV_3434381 [Trichonephila clavipes]